MTGILHIFPPIRHDLVIYDWFRGIRKVYSTIFLLHKVDPISDSVPLEASGLSQLVPEANH